MQFSYTLHPTPYTLHPTLYILHHAPYTIHYILYTIYHTLCTIYHTSNIKQARRLTAANKNMFSGGGASSDPLVLLKIEGNKIDSKVCCVSAAVLYTHHAKHLKYHTPCTLHIPCSMHHSYNIYHTTYRR
ncbi:hypothetical protein EON63_10150 [archaeon]|nr:MAG: hypothetical protein EON63_10150 [archaeon]